jgi:photosystem II stability/assembly factor-like uncharacterized protein
MLRALTVALIGMAALVSVPAHAAPQDQGVVAGVDFANPGQGWVALSSSAYYGSACQRATVRQAACRTATTLLYETRDGGLTWRSVLRVQSAPLAASGSLPQMWIHPYSSTTIDLIPLTVSSAAARRLFITDNAARTWRSYAVPATIGATGPSDVATVDPRHIWILRHEGIAAGSESVSVFRTTSGGAGWTRIACTAVQLPLAHVGRCTFGSGLRYAGRKDNLTFGNDTRGWLTTSTLSGTPSLYVTSDGGVTWRLQRPPLPHGVAPSAAATGRNVIQTYHRPVVFGSTVILPDVVTVCVNEPGPSISCRSVQYALLSHDAGRTWTGSRTIPSGVLGPGAGPLQFLNARDWWSVDGPRLWSTTDAGQYWRATRLHLPAGRTVLQLQFASSRDGWAVIGAISPQGAYAQHVALLHTTDGGSAWSAVHLPPAAHRPPKV